MAAASFVGCSKNSSSSSAAGNNTTKEAVTDASGKEVSLRDQIAAKKYDSEGKVIASDRLATAGKPHHIIANVDKKTLKANGVDLAYIDYVVVDKQGNVVPTPVNLTFSVKGAATLQAQASGDMLSHEPWQGSNSRTTYNGRCQLILRTGQAAGKVKVTAKTKGIPTSTLLLQVTDTCQ